MTALRNQAPGEPSKDPNFIELRINRIWLRGWWARLKSFVITTVTLASFVALVIQFWGWLSG